MKNTLIFLSLCSLLFFVQCSSKSERAQNTMSLGDEQIEMNEEIAFQAKDQAQNLEDYELEKGSKIIKEGNLGFEVKDAKAAKSKIDNYLKRVNAYYENEQFSASNYQDFYTLSIRVPQAKFDTLILFLENGAGKLTAKNISAKDVTEEYVDLNIRLNNNLAYLEQYKTLLKKANSIKDILEVQEKIRNLEEEIDSKKGRIKFLDDKVQYSTIHLELRQEKKYEVTETAFISRVEEGFKSGFQLLQDFVVGLINLWPFLLILFLILFFRKNVFGLFRRK